VRLFAALSALLLLASGLVAPGVRERRARADELRLYDPDPKVRARTAEREGWLGAALNGYLEWAALEPHDLEAQRGLFRAGMRLSAAGLGQVGIENEVVRPRIVYYLENRARLDPDGSLLRAMLAEWIDLRLKHDWFKMRAAVAMHLAGIGDPRGVEVLLALARDGPFHAEFFPYARRFHPRFPGVRALAEHYLRGGNLAGRVQAGVTVADYAVLFGEGTDLLETFGAEIRAALRETVSHLAPTTTGDFERIEAGHAAIFGLVALGGAGEIALLRSLDPVRNPAYAATMRVARIGAGLEPPPDPLSDDFRSWTQDLQERFYRLAAYRFARARAAAVAAASEEERALAEEEARRWHRFVDAAFHQPDTVIQIGAFHALAALDPDAKDLPERVAREKNVLALFAGAKISGDRVPVLLPGLYAPAIHLDYQALAAVHLWEQLR
jgi:hypothetical protein